MTTKRIKRVFGSNDEVAHVWAQQSQSDGKSGNMYFQNTTDIYSYGAHFLAGKFHKALNGAPIVLVNSHVYSNSTSKHLRSIRGAVSHLISFTVPFVSSPKERENYQYLSNKAADAMSNLLNANSLGKWGEDKAESFLEHLENCLAAYNKYVWAFGVCKGMPKELALDGTTRSDLIDLIDVKIKRTKELKAIKDALTPDEVKELADKRAKALARKFEYERQLWLDGGTNSTKHFSRDEVFCRIMQNRVETTKGAKVPLDEALKLVSLINKNKDIQGVKIGHYTVTELTKDTLIIGCHRIPLSEVTRLFSNVTQLRKA